MKFVKMVEENVRRFYKYLLWWEEMMNKVEPNRVVWHLSL